MSEETRFFKLMRVNGGKALVRLVKGDDGHFVPADPGTKRFLANSPSYTCLTRCHDEKVLKFGLTAGIGEAQRAVKDLGIEGIQVSSQ